MYRPLADEVRPGTLDEVVGQQHILGKECVLRRIVESGHVPNLIFYGPPGTGKTTVARIIAEKAGRHFCHLNATTASISDVREVLKSSGSLLSQNGILLYLDEIQYFNRKQQQSLLESMESGEMVLIAATTENPYFHIFDAILSRSTVFEFRAVEAEEICRALERGIRLLEEREGAVCELEDGTLEIIAQGCGGDVRKALNALELLFSAGKREADRVLLGREDAASVTQKSALRYDRDGDGHYDLLSAFQKSIRGSDPDAGVFYLARLLACGDLTAVCRRLLVIAAEDIGLAYPLAMPIVKSCVDSALQIGLPEARIPLAEAVVLLATSPKSDSAIQAVSAAAADVDHGLGTEIPAFLRDAHYTGAKELGHGTDYVNPHSARSHYLPVSYLPEELKGRHYYQYGGNKVEQAARKYWDLVRGTEE